MSDVADTIDLACLTNAYTPTAQIAIAFALGVLFSPWTATFVVILFFLIIWEAIVFAVSHARGGWDIIPRIATIFAYVAGWILGRSLFDTHHNILNTEDDEHLRGHIMGRRGGRRANK